MTHILVEKALRRLTLWQDGAPPRRFSIALGACPSGPKRAEGDGKTPEGRYFVCTRNAQSKYYLSLGLSYPSAADAERAFAEGRIDEAVRASIRQAEAERRRPPWDTPLGGFIMLHGGGAASDWTAGCVALDDRDMDVLWAACPLGTEVEIRA